MTAATLALPAGITAVLLEAAALADAGPVDPELVPCGVCGEPPLVHDDVEAGHNWAPSEARVLADRAIAAAEAPLMGDIVAHLDDQHVPSGKTGPSPSDAGACRRALWYRDRPPADYTPRTIDARRAAIGTLIHQAGARARAGRYPWRMYELQVDVPGLVRAGRVDEYDPVLGRVIDWKSAGERKWDIIGDDGPTPDQWAQVRIYGYALDAGGYPVRELQIITVNRDTGEEEEFLEAYDPQRALAALDDLIEVGLMIDGGVLPPRDGYGPADWRCQWCPALNHCWNVDAAKAAERSPESYTLLGAIPEDPSIVWAGLELIRLSAERLALEKSEDRAKALLQGIKPGKYGADRADGGIEIADKWNTGRSYKEAFEKLLACYVLPEEQRPAVEELAEVPTTRSKSTVAKRPRAATRTARKKTTAKKTTAQDGAQG